MKNAKPAVVPQVRQLVTVRRLCSLMHISRTTLWRLGQTKDFPAPFILSSRSVRYDLAEVQQWLAKRQK